MFRRFAPTLAIVVVTMMLTTLFQPLSFLEAFAQQDSCRAFPETGRIVCGKFLAFWEKNGGLPAFGYPITNRFPQVSRMDHEEYDTQYFEHAIFELHPENPPPHDVQLAHAGTSVFNTRYPKGNPLATYPLYPNGRSFTYEQTERAFILSFVTRFQTNDSPDVARTYFDKLLLSRGWERTPSRASSSVTYRFVEPWDIPECQPGFQGTSPFLPCASTYLLDISATASGGLTHVVETLEHDTFCCHAAGNNALPAMK